MSCKKNQVCFPKSCQPELVCYPAICESNCCPSALPSALPNSQQECNLFPNYCPSPCIKPPICGIVGPFGTSWLDTPCVENPGCYTQDLIEFKN